MLPSAQWAAYEEIKGTTYLQYRTALDDRVRAEHAALEGVTLPLDDPFWDTAFPPNGWNCRCHVIPVPQEGHTTSNSEAARLSFRQLTEGRDSIFRFNPGKEAVLFPPHHPYYGKQGYRHCANQRLAANDDKHDPGDPCRVYRTLKEIEQEERELTDARESAKKNIQICKKMIPPFDGFAIVEGKEVVSGRMLILRGSLDSIREHAYTDINVQKWLSELNLNYPLKVRYIGWGEVRYKEMESGKKERKHPEAELFTYYEVEIAGKPYYINAKAHRRYNLDEVIYTIEPTKPTDLKNGIPDTYNKTTRK